MSAGRRSVPAGEGPRVPEPRASGGRAPLAVRLGRFAWPILLASAVLEAVWATALGASDGLTRLGPALVFAVALTASMVGLGIAMPSIGLGTSYAVWVGVGAALTVGWAMSTGSEPASPLRLVFLVGLVACVVGLQLVPGVQRTGEADCGGRVGPGG